jgi:hypothetical protein
VGLRNRLEKLEGVRRERDVDLLRAFWQSLDVEECALLAAYATAEEMARERTEERHRDKQDQAG